MSFNYSSRIPVTTCEGLFFFRPDEIVRLEASSNYTFIHFVNRKPMLIAKLLGDYEVMLTEYGFIRTHRSHLVNKRYVTYIDMQGNIIMQDSSKAGISRRKKKDVLKVLRNSVFRAKIVA